MKSIRSDPCWHRGCRNYWQNGTKREDEDARCLGRYISTISRVARWKSSSRHSARKIVSGLTIQSHVPLSTRPPLLRAFQEFSRAEFLLIYDTFAMPLTRQVACICELFFFFFFLPLPSFLFTQSHSTMPRKRGRGKFQRDRQICRRHVRARLIRFAANFRKLLDVWMSFVISIREWRDYFGKTLRGLLSVVG